MKNDLCGVDNERVIRALKGRLSFFIHSTVPSLNFDMSMIFNREIKTHLMLDHLQVLKGKSVRHRYGAF